ETPLPGQMPMPNCCLSRSRMCSHSRHLRDTGVVPENGRSQQLRYLRMCVGKSSRGINTPTFDVTGLPLVRLGFCTWPVPTGTSLASLCAEPGGRMLAEVQPRPARVPVLPVVGLFVVGANKLLPVRHHGAHCRIERWRIELSAPDLDISHYEEV